MPQIGYQTILLYGSQTPGAIPSASNLVANQGGVELAVNSADGKLFYKDATGTVRVIADANRIGASGVASITSGTIDGAVIGSINPSEGTFTNLTTDTFTLTGVAGILKSNGGLGVVAATPGVDYVSPAVVGVANGVASLDSSGKVPLSQLPSSLGGLVYLGTWNASTNTPTLNSGVGTSGFFYKVSVAGSTNLDGITTWNIGDQVVFNGTAWERVADAAAPVTSVNGMTGAVTITRASLSAAASGANSDITSLTGLTTSISVAQGGTGRTTLSGLLKGNGTAAVTSAVAGTDYAPATPGTVSQLLSSNGAGGFTAVNVGAGLDLSAGVLTATGGGTGGGGGSVTSVNVVGGTTGLTTSGGPITGSGTITLAGTLSVAHGGTGRASLSGMLKGNGTSAVATAIPGVDYAPAPLGTAAQLLASDGSGGFSAVSIGSGLSYNAGVLASLSSGGSVSSVNVSGGSTGLTFSGGPITTSGTLTLAGTLAVTNGGTGRASLSGIIKGNGTSAVSTAIAGIDYAPATNGNNAQLLANSGSGGFANVTLGAGLTYTGGVLSATSVSSGTVTSVNVSGGTTGLSFSGGPITGSGTLTMAGIVSVASGGTGVANLTGLVKGNGSSAFTSASAGIDYATPPTGSASQLLANNGTGGFSNVTLGSGLTYTGGVLAATASAALADGSVTDVKVAVNAAIQATKLAYQSGGTGASARTVAAKIGDFVSVKDFGAVGDGVANDTNAINNANTYAQSIGSTVFFPAGTYSVTSFPTLTGKVTWWSMNNATIKGSLAYSQVFPTAATTTTSLTPASPKLTMEGMSFSALNASWGLTIYAQEQGNFLNTFSLIGCKFYGYHGLLAQHAMGYTVHGCDFFTAAYGAYLEGCSNGDIAGCNWYNQSATALRFTPAGNHGGSGSGNDKGGGFNNQVTNCMFMGCVTGLFAIMTTNLHVSSCIVDKCASPIRLLGARNTKLDNVYAMASNTPTSTLSGVVGYEAPGSSGIALHSAPYGYLGGEYKLGISAHNCDFLSSVTGANQAVATIDGYFNASYTMSGDQVSFIDCLFKQTVTHSAATLLYIRNFNTVRVISNKFVSPNLSTTLVNAWRAENCTSYTGVLNEFNQCTQSSAVVGSSYEKLLASVFVQSADPGAVGAGSFWIQP